jgi:hypothetical protein
MCRKTYTEPGLLDSFWFCEAGRRAEVIERWWAVQGSTCGPLIKSPAEDLPQNTQQNESSAKEEDS